METIMNIKGDIHTIYHTFLYKNNGQISASQKNLTVYKIRILVPSNYAL